MIWRNFEYRRLCQHSRHLWRTEKPERQTIGAGGCYMLKNIDNQATNGEEKSKPELIKLGLDLHARWVLPFQGAERLELVDRWERFHEPRRRRDLAPIHT
jgi:hypothetical protein